MDVAEQKALELIAVRLQQRFPMQAEAEIRREVVSAYQLYDQSRVRTYISILVEREVAERLTLLGANSARASASASIFGS